MYFLPHPKIKLTHWSLNFVKEQLETVKKPIHHATKLLESWCKNTTIESNYKIGDKISDDAPPFEGILKTVKN